MICEFIAALICIIIFFFLICIMIYFARQLLKFCINQCPNVSFLIFLWYLLDLILLMVAIHENQLLSLSALFFFFFNHFQSMYLTVLNQVLK